MIQELEVASRTPTKTMFPALQWLRNLFTKKPPSNLIIHARNELAAMNMEPNSIIEDPNKWMAQNVLELLEVFSKQGHSGFSSAYCINVFAKLARFEPLGPLTGADSEWQEVGTSVFQNKRCSHVFKQPDRFDGQAYDLDGKVFREPNGACYTSSDSLVPITFPYTPHTEYVDVPAPQEDSK